MLVDLLRHDRIVIVGGLLGIIVLSWAYLLAGAEMDMETMSGMLMPRTSPVWTPGYFALTLTMWAVMMAAMMLPSASPMLLLYERRVGNPPNPVVALYLLALVSLAPEPDIGPPPRSRRSQVRRRYHHFTLKTADRAPRRSRRAGAAAEGEPPTSSKV